MLLEGELSDDDPTFQPIPVIAQQQRVTEMTVRRYIKLHPERIEKRRVRRAGFRSPVWVYRLKDVA